ncbi:MAG: hypothetical protein K2W95_01580 [Candidatus Obscuribacterales bacterium]|nr:hypothetical protein [Candidatus Obscuribacterales bacterium]
MNRSKQSLLCFGLMLCALSAIPSAQADYISPNIKDSGKQYSQEKPDEAYYGTGQGGRLVESFELRMQVDGLLRDHRWDDAIRKARKAVQCDPGYPENHLLLARGLAGKLYEEKGPIDEKLLADSIHEWNLIRWHDADVSEQLEARAMLSQLHRIAKTLEKDKIIKARVEQQKRAAEALLEHKVTSDMDKVAATGASKEESKEAATNPGSDNKSLDEVANKLAQKQKKRFLLF